MLFKVRMRNDLISQFNDLPNVTEIELRNRLGVDHDVVKTQNLVESFLGLQNDGSRHCKFREGLEEISIERFNLFDEQLSEVFFAVVKTFPNISGLSFITQQVNSRAVDILTRRLKEERHWKMVTCRHSAN